MNNIKVNSNITVTINNCSHTLNREEAWTLFNFLKTELGIIEINQNYKDYSKSFYDPYTLVTYPFFTTTTGNCKTTTSVDTKMLLKS